MSEGNKFEGLDARAKENAPEIINGKKITDLPELMALYKASKARFDVDAEFKKLGFRFRRKDQFVCRCCTYDKRIWPKIRTPPQLPASLTQSPCGDIWATKRPRIALNWDNAGACALSSGTELITRLNCA